MRRIRRRVLQVLATGAIAAGALAPAAASAQEYPTPSTTPTVSTDPGDPNASSTGVNQVGSATVGSGTNSSSNSNSNSASGTLPVTGGQIAGLTLAGLCATAAGFALVLAGRRRHADVAP